MPHDSTQSLTPDDPEQTFEPDSPDDAASPEAAPQGWWRRNRRLLLGVITPCVLVTALVVTAFLVPAGKVIEAPGPTWNVLGTVQDASSGQDRPVIAVSGTQTYPASGALRMTTVTVYGCQGTPVSVGETIIAWFQSDSTVIDREQVCPESVPPQQVEEANLAQMTSSQSAAVTAALIETGHTDSMTLTVQGLAEAQSAPLQQGDVLAAVTTPDGQRTEITTFTSVQDLMTTVPEGTALTLTVTRDGQAVDVPLTTVRADVDGDGTVDREGSLLGVSLSIDLNTGIDASFNLDNVGGPSAGSMFALGIVDAITPGDLTGGKDIAGTGTISPNGAIGPIGGIVQKMEGAAAAGSQWFLAPASNCAEVVGNEPEGLQVIAVEDLHEAVTAVQAIAAGDTASLPACQAATASATAG